MKNKKYLVILIIITIITIFSRAVVVFNPYNYFFNPEQGTEYLVTKSIVVDHKIVLTAHQGGFGGFSKGPGFNYLLAIPFILTQGDPFGGRLFMLIISVLTVPLAFVFANRMFGLQTASLISFLLAISPNLKDYAGGISPPFIIPLITVFFIYFLFMIFHEHKKFIPLLLFLVGLMTHFEIATAGVLTALLVFTAIICAIKKPVPYRYYFYSLLLFLLTLTPIIISDIFSNFTNIKGVIKIIQSGANHTVGFSESNFIEIFTSRIFVFYWNFISTFSSNIFILLTVFILILSGTILYIRDKNIDIKNRLFVLYLSIIPIFTFLFILFYPDKTVQQWWLLDLTIIYCYLLGIYINYFWRKSNFKKIIFILLLILSLAFIKRTIFLYQTQFTYPPNTYIKENQVIKYIFKNSKSKKFGIVVFSSREQENYDYLIWWNGNKYGYQPYRSPKGTYYVIIEPNLIYSLNKAPGNLISTELLSNGFIIEERFVY